MSSGGAGGYRDGVRPTNLEIAAVLAFTLGMWFALMVAGLGVSSVLFDRDVITDPRAGVGLGPAMFFASLIVFALTLAATAARRRRTHRTDVSYAAPAVLAAAIAYVAFVIMAATGWLLFVPGLPADAFDFALSSALDWPAIVLVLVSFVDALAYFAYLSWRIRNVD
jgi:hypothetical protein